MTLQRRGTAKQPPKICGSSNTTQKEDTPATTTPLPRTHGQPQHSTADIRHIDVARLTRPSAPCSATTRTPLPSIVCTMRITIAYRLIPSCMIYH